MRFTLSSVAATLALASHSLAAIVPDTTLDERFLVRRALRTGLGTKYGDDCTEEDCWQGGACSFTDYTLPASIDGSTCVSEDIWNDGYNCGGCVGSHHVMWIPRTLTLSLDQSQLPRQDDYCHGHQSYRRRQEPP